MAQDNVEIVKHGLALWNAGDMDGFRDLYAPDATLNAPDGWPEPGPFVGRDAVMRQYERLRESFDSDQLESLVDPVVAGDRAVARVRWRAAGHGPESALEVSVVFTLHDGKVQRADYYWGHDEALAAARAT